VAAARGLHHRNLTAAGRSAAERSFYVQEGTMKKLLTLLMLLCFVGVTVGCEASAKVDDDNGKAKIEIDD
jgi:hypothetical protein